jgi:hypothetical protein
MPSSVHQDVEAQDSGIRILEDVHTNHPQDGHTNHPQTNPQAPGTSAVHGRLRGAELFENSDSDVQDDERAVSPGAVAVPEPPEGIAQLEIPPEEQLEETVESRVMVNEKRNKLCGVSRQFFWFGVCFLALTVGVGVSFGVALPKTTNQSSAARTTARPTTSWASLFDLLLNYNVSIQALQDPSSPQYAALFWMVNNDSIDIALSDDELIERFALVLFYLVTGGDSWFDQAHFLSPLSTCSWNSIVERDEEKWAITIGVGCNDDGSVVELNLGKSRNST